MAQWPEWGTERPGHQWLTVTGTAGDHHAGEVLHTILGRNTLDDTCIYHVLRCHPCMLIHVWPFPPPEGLTEYYQDQFYQRAHKDYLARYEQDREWWICTHQTILFQARKHLHAISPTLLDIGTGPGIALDTARGLGFLTYGLEPDKHVADIVRQRGHTIWTETLSTYALWGGEPFDCLYAYEVLEHQAQPEDFLLTCWELLKPGGILALEVPNDYNPLQLQAQALHYLPPYWLAPPEHLTYFTPKTLQLLLRRCGFDLLHYRSTYPLEAFMLPSGTVSHAITADDLTQPVVYVNRPMIGRACHQARMQYELDMWKAGRWQEIEQLYTQQLKEHDIGRELVAIARKRA